MYTITDRHHWAKNYSRALENLVNGLGLTDACDANPTRSISTHSLHTQRCIQPGPNKYQPQSPTLKNGVDTVVAAFTDYLAIVIRIAIDKPILSSGRGPWEMKMPLLRETEFGKVLQKHWNRLKTHTKYYPKVEMLWERNTKRR